MPAIDPTVASTLAALALALLVAEALLVWLRRRDRAEDPGRDRTNLARRIRSWWVIVAAGALALLAGRTATLLALAIVSYLALKEYLSMVPTRRADRAVLLLCYLAIPTQWWWIAEERYGFFIIW